MPANFFLRYKLHHLAGWLLLFAFWYFLRYEDYRVPGRAFLITLIKVIDLAILIYTTNYLFIPQLFYKKRYGWFALAFILLVVVSSTIKMNILGRIMDRPDLYSLSGDLKRKIYDNMIPHFFLGIAGAAIKVMIDYTRLQKRLAEIATEKAAAELKFLKSQINPHFLFNSLNSVYFLIDRNNTVARESLHKFSDMLRYQLYEMNGERIPVEREISYLQDYVSLQQLRKDEKYTVSFECAPGVSNFSLEPLLLIPFVENAFKHVSSHVDKLNFVKIALARNDGEFVFTTENSTGPDKATDPHSGIGLTNVRRRLELLYPGKFDLDVRDN
ncbi:MAG TPA: histidine kinase, partial [Chitinophagaceae bacterium]|nr:histidine kinase [Chitinophagaceae bacterium]